MTEKLLQYIWQFQYFNRHSLTTTSGEPVAVLFQGNLNKHQGPDFLNARIRIGETEWVGAVELHINASEWWQHQHQNDPNYQQVILHVVYRLDEAAAKNKLPTIELASRISGMLLQQYTAFMQAEKTLPCAPSISQVSAITWLSWKERLVAERLTRKSKVVLQYFEESNHNWEEVFWWLLARHFGSTVNGDAFEAIARSIPVNLLSKHKQHLLQLEALLLGQAHLLDIPFTESYPLQLQKEYQFLKSKYQLSQVHHSVYFLRMRPGNFPTIRLAQLAMLVHTSSHLLAALLEKESLQEIKQLLQVTASDYWNVHYRLGEASSFKKKNVGKSTIASIIINTILPVLFAYGAYHKQEPYQTKALQWLAALEPESNSITNSFEQLQVPNKTAFDSQALIELNNEYCSKKRCLECSIGNFILKRS